MVSLLQKVLMYCLTVQFLASRSDNQTTWMISLSVAVLWREVEMNLDTTELDKEAQFAMKKPKYSVIHWDGKIVSDMRGDGVELVYY